MLYIVNNFVYCCCVIHLRLNISHLFLLSDLNTTEKEKTETSSCLSITNIVSRIFLILNEGKLKKKIYRNVFMIILLKIRKVETQTILFTVMGKFEHLPEVKCTGSCEKKELTFGS